MLFFGNKDIKVTIEGRPSFTVGALNKVLIATNETDIPVMAISGSDGITELEKYLSTNSKVAPKLVKAVTQALGQEDVSGNKLTTEYIFILGKATTQDVVNAIKEFDETKQSDFYAIATTFEDMEFEKWAQLYAPRHIYFTFTANGRDIVDTGKSTRIFGINDENAGVGTEEFPHVAWMARVLFLPLFAGWKFKKLNGITAEEVTDGAVTLDEKKGWNRYRIVRGRGNTSGSITTDAKGHIDETILKDTVVYNCANVLQDMFEQNEIVPMAFAGKKLVEGYLDKAMQYVATLGMIERGEDGRPLYEITVPEITATMKSLRELSAVKIYYSPSVPMESITVTGREILEWVEGGNA